jgi:hypothetical protein
MATAECIGIAAQYYNLALVIVVLILYLKLLKLPSGKIYILPWKYIFLSLLVYVIEQVLSILNTAGAIAVSALVFPMLEFVIITIFIYTMLILREHIKGAKVEQK